MLRDAAESLQRPALREARVAAGMAPHRDAREGGTAAIPNDTHTVGPRCPIVKNRGQCACHGRPFGHAEHDSFATMGTLNRRPP